MSQRPPQERRRMSPRKSGLIGFAAALFLVVTLCASAYWWVAAEYTALGPLTESKTLIFRKGTGFKEIAKRMAAEGVVRHRWYLKGAALLTGQAGRFKAGEYEFPAGINVKDAINMLAEGKVVIHKITVPEGVTSREVLRLLNAEQVLEGELPASVAEGSLLPETYHFTYGDQRAGLIDRMQQGMRDVVRDSWAKRQDGLPLSSPHEALVLASIVERETGLDSERGRVAAVYINRLRLGMKLQADPTVMYGVALAQDGEMKRPLTLKDLQTPSPYNTYLNAGLPPTPIGNPGRASLKAVLDPPQTREIFFVATGHGGHRFAETLAQHNRNVAAYRATQNAGAATAREDAAR